MTKTKSLSLLNVEYPGNGREVEGGYLTEDCTLLAVGVWNGTKYVATELAKSANRWRDNSVWNRHYEGKQRDESNRVGLLKNIHFDDYRIAGDVFLSNGTPEGRDIIELVKADKLKGLSVEHMDYMVDGISTDIEFLGIAIVPEPGCRICSLGRQEAKDMEDKEIKELQKQVKELEATKDKVADLEATIKELKEVDVDTIVKEQSRKDSKVIEALEKRVKELEDTPVVNTTVANDIVDSYALYVHTNEGTFTRVL